MCCKQGFLRLVAGVISTLFLAMFFFSVPAFGEQPQVMRVGWFQQNKYQQTDEHGKQFGYNYEYLMRIAQHTGWEYEFVEVDSFAESYEMLVNGQIDIMGYTLYSDARAEEVAYPELGCGSVSTSLFVKRDSPIEEYNFGDFDGMRVASIESQNPTYLTQYASENNFSVNMSYYHNTQAVVDAVMSGEVDAGLGAGHQSDEDSRIVASFAPRQCYFVLNKSNESALAQLNNALTHINIETPFYDRELAFKYLPEVNSIVSLTKAEKEFIKDNPTIEVSYYDNWFPISYIDTTTDVFGGISFDVFERVSQATGLTFTYTPITTGSQEERNATVIAGMVHDYTHAYELDHRLTAAYVNVPLVMVRRRDFDKEAPETTAMSQNMVAGNSYITVKETRTIAYSTIYQTLDALVDREADQAMLNAFAGEYLLRQTRYKKLQSFPIYSETYSVGIAVKNNAAPELHSILNKAVDTISDAEMNGIINRKISNTMQINLSNIASQMPTDVILIAVVGLVAIIVLLLLFLHKQRKYSRKIQTVLYTDELTGIFSFKGFLAQAAVNIAKSSSGKIFIIDFDINHFSAFNNINGFAMGNQLLRTVADVTAQFCKESEICGRIQADHFVVLAFDRDVPNINQQIVEAQQLLRKASGRSALLITYGVYEVVDRKMSVVDMCARALAAKNTIKGSYDRYIAFYDMEVHSKEVHDIKILERFESALAAGEFVHYLQPKYSSDTCCIVGAEALVRWIRPDGEIIMPGQFIELLEMNGLIAKLDMYMFERLCERMSWLIAQGNELFPVSINFSRVHLYDSGFAERLINLIEKYNIPASLLEIEITETAIVDKKKEVTAMVDVLHQAGFLISIDDFGSGFSSLNVLKDMDFDVIKLDRVFLSSIDVNGKCETVISSIVELARKLKLKTVAEGVETAGQFQMLKDCGCDMVQGFYFARPMPEDEFLALSKQYVPNK